MIIGDLTGGAYEINTVESFGWFGKNVRISPTLSELDLVDLAEEASAAMSEESGLKQLTFIKDSLRKIVHPGDFDDFWKIAREKKVSLEYLANVQNKVIAYIAKRPTQSQSSLSGGQAEIATSSVETRDATVSPLTAMDVRYAERELQGRPDLRLALLSQAEHRLA